MTALVIAVFLASGWASGGSRVDFVDLVSPAVASSADAQFSSSTHPAGVLFRVGEGALDASPPGVEAPLPSGRTISVDVEDADIRSVLRLFSATADLDFVLDDSVQARVTARLVDVPWDLALLAILQSNGLVAVPVDGGGPVQITSR
jgi:hypothetical protein